MSTRRPLSLTDDQLATIMRCAAHVSPRWRAEYLRSVADLLEPLTQPSDDDVNLAASIVLGRRGSTAA
jgi:hypothetical protein